MNAHPSAEDLASRVWDELSPERRAEVDEHVAHCDACRLVYVDYERIVALSAEIRYPDPPAHREFNLPPRSLSERPLIELAVPAAGIALVAALAVFSSSLRPGGLPPATGVAPTGVPRSPGVGVGRVPAEATATVTPTATAPRR